MMIKVNKSEILKSMDKAAISCNDSFIFSIGNARDSHGNVIATVSASDGTTQVLSALYIKSDVLNYRFIVGIEILNVLKAVGEFGDEYSIEVTDTKVVISAGSATMPIAIKQDATFLELKANGTCIDAAIDREAFIKGVRKGSFAYGDANCHQYFQKTVAFHPVTKDGESLLNILSSNGKMGTRSSISVLQTNQDFTNANNYISIDAPSLRNICNKLEGDQIQLKIYDKQFYIKAGNDIYTIVRYETVFPDLVGEVLDKNDYNFKAVLDVQTLKAALKVATILEEKIARAALLSISNNGAKKEVTISSVLGTNRANVIAEDIEGEIQIVLNAVDIETALLDLKTDKVTFYGLGDKNPVYIEADGVKVFTLPVKTQTAGK